MTLKAGVDETGVAQFVSMDIFSDSGFSFYDDTSSYAELHARVKTKLINNVLCTLNRTTLLSVFKVRTI